MRRMFVYAIEFDVLWLSVFRNFDILEDVEKYLIEHPKSGNVIKGTNGLRKSDGKLIQKANGEVLEFYMLILKNMRYYSLSLC